MPVFQYKGRNQRGEAVRGYLEAATPDAVANQLFNTGVTPIDIVSARARDDVWAALRTRMGTGRVRLEEQILFCRQMYTLIKSGVPIMQSLRGLRDSTENPALAQVIGGIGDALDSGLDLTNALKRFPRVFSSLFVSIVQVGETTGSLDNSFRQLAQYLELEKETRDRIKAAVRYPTFVLIAIAIAMIVINIWVIPAFAKVFANFHTDLPWATQALIAVSNFSIHYGHYVLLSGLAAGFAVHAYVNTPQGRYRWHRYKLKTPIVGGIFNRAMLGRFARALAMTVRAGVPLVQGLTVVARAVDNDFIGARVLQIRDGVERGETVTRTAAATGMFPPLVLQMISVGEETGAIDDLMDDVGDYYEREVDYDIKNLSATIEPVLITGIGILVLILALGVFLPMWDLVHAVRGR